MRFGQKRNNVTVDTNEIVHNNAAASQNTRSGMATALASGVALLFSAVSLYQSALKQPELQFYVSPVVHYTLERSTNVEIFAVPLTIANHGARDGAVLGINLDVEGSDGTKKRFYSAYVVDGDFFAPPDRFNQQTRSFDRAARPKEPFAPLSVAGRSHYTGTVLFYAKSKPYPKVVAEKGEFKLTISLETKLDESLGVVDKFLRTQTKPIAFTAKLKRYSKQLLSLGGTHRMSDVAWAGSEEKTQPASAGPAPVEQ